MDDSFEIPDESMRHIEALLARHRPEMIQRMFQQAMESRRSSVASSHVSSTGSLASTGASSLRSSIAASYRTSTTSSYHSRLSIASNMSTSTLSTVNSDMAPSIASSTSTLSMLSSAPSRRAALRSYPHPSLDHTRHVPPMLTPTSDLGSPLEPKRESESMPRDEDMSIASFPTDQGASQLGESQVFCTYCAESKTLKTFKAKSDWKKHEMRMHETGEDWPCVVHGCNRIFDRQKDFLKHHQRHHSGRPLPALTDIGIQLLPRRVFGCGFDKCKEVSVGWDERCDHVAKHMKNGSTYDQWKYSNVIRNLIRQEALHDTWKDIIACLDERLRESRSQISWSLDNTRILRQKLQCCDLRPSREEVLITALSLRADFAIDPAQQQLPLGFVVPSRDSVPNVDELSREQRMHILNGNPNVSLSRSRLAAVNSALVRASKGIPDVSSYDCNTLPFDEQAAAAAERRISYMDIDPTDSYLNISQSPIPEIQVPNPDPQPPLMDNQPSQNSGFVDPAKPVNPLEWCYPNYFDCPPAFEDSHFYQRPSLGQMLSKPLQRMSSRLRHGVSANRATSQAEMHGLPVAASHEYPMLGHMNPTHFPSRQQSPIEHQYRHVDTLSQQQQQQQQQ